MANSTISTNNIAIWQKAAISYYRHIFDDELKAVANVQDIPARALVIMSYYTPKELYIPQVAEAFARGVEHRAIARQTGLTVGQVRGIGRRLGVMK